jgi:hypothetical protein
VEVNGQASVPSSASTQQQQTQQTYHASTPAPSQIPPIDPTILDHAATDFSMPEYPQQEQYAPSPITGEPIVMTDEISDQFRNYNTNGTYHRS